MEEDTGGYYDGHFSQDGLYTGEGEYHEMDPNYEGQFAEYAGTGEEYETNNEFVPLSNVLGDGGVGISPLAFDTHEELLWMANQAGHVTSYYGTQLSKYTSFQVNANEGIRALSTFDRGILALSQTSLRGQLRRGIPMFTHHSAHMMGRREEGEESELTDIYISLDRNAVHAEIPTETNSAAAGRHPG